MHKSFIAVALASAVLSSVPAAGQLTVTEIGGSLFGDNFSTRESSSAFGKDEIGGGSLASHKIPQVRDEIYGNSNSWIGDSTNSFIGISFGETPLSVGRIAFGRDNTGEFTDRTAGTFTLQYTTIPNPDATTPEISWLTIGSVTQSENDGGLFSSARRKAFSFTPVNATGLRLITPGSGFSGGAAIDELEFTSFAPAPLTLQGTNGTMDPALNVALASNGGFAFAKDVINNAELAPHQIPHLNDGLYGNSNSWIGNSEDSFAGVRFALPQTIERLAFGRDNTGGFADRADGYYLVQYTRDANPDETTPDTSWIDIGPAFIGAADADRALRHEYSFDPVSDVTGLRIITPGNGIGTGRAIDELEVYAVPEPGSAVLALIGGAVLGCRRRSGAARR